MSLLYFTHNYLYSCCNIRYQQPNILPFPCLYGMFLYVFVVFYTQSLVLMLQYQISTTKHSTVPLFIWYVLLCLCCILHTITCTNVTISHITNQTLYRSLVYTVCSCMCFCILHTITSTNVTISHINNQTVYRSCVYTLCSFMSLLYFTHNHLYSCCNITYQQLNILPIPCLYGMFLYVFVVFYTQSLVLMLQYHISTTKHSTVPLLIQYVLLCVFVFYTQSLVLMLQYHISTTKHSTVPLFIRYVLVCVCCILHTITSTNVKIPHINNQTFYRSLVYTVCSCMCLLYFTHNYLY
jgi:hypothetical protein